MNHTEAEVEWLRTIGRRLRLARVARRETQAELAERAATTRVTLGSVERAEHAANLLTYARIARALDVSLGELLGGAP